MKCSAVAMHSGDLVIFNAMEPYAILSRCHENININCAAMYLKTYIVGLNDNNLNLTKRQ